jgi:hypothetical protein
MHFFDIKDALWAAWISFNCPRANKQTTGPQTFALLWLSEAWKLAIAIKVCRMCIIGKRELNTNAYFVFFELVRVFFYVCTSSDTAYMHI